MVMTKGSYYAISFLIMIVLNNWNHGDRYFVKDRRKKDNYVNTKWVGPVESDYVWNVAYEGGRNTRDNPRSQDDSDTIPVYDPDPHL